MSEPLKFTMEFEPATIDDLGAKLYVTLAPVIVELISNAYDADAENVELNLPEGPISGDSAIVVKDDGTGMDETSIQEAYLRIGRKRREVTGKERSDIKNRPLMGRKGLGKLSAFGIAKEIEIRTVKEGRSICLILNYDRIKTWQRGKPYEPEIVDERTGNVNEPNGTEIILRNLVRRRSIDIGKIRRDIARRFTIIDNDFAISVNGLPIKPEDRRLKNVCKKTWDVGSKDEFPIGNVVDQSEGWEVTGWIGLVEKSSQIERGVDIFARGKALELETMFGLKTTHIQFARAYVVGEIHAEFLDGKEDHISTGRSSAQWESDAGQKLKEWGGKALTYVFKKWLDLQKREKEDKILGNTDFKSWLDTRTPYEQKVAERLFDVIVSDKNIEPESASPLLEIIKSNVEFQAFHELVEEIAESGANVQTLLRLFDDWKIIEAREHLKLADGRLEVIDKLANYIETGALEVQQMQPLFENNGWLVNPSWAEVTGQTTYTDLLRQYCKEPKNLDEGDRRIDILGYEVGGTVHVVELKRPQKTLSRKDLEQIEEYVDWARTNFISTGPDSAKFVTGLLLVGKLSQNNTTIQKQIRLAGADIRVETYRDLKVKAEKIYGEVEKRLRSKAPEYSRTERKKKNQANK